MRRATRRRHEPDAALRDVPEVDHLHVLDVALHERDPSAVG
jgi:hypothetical protein